MLVVPSRFALSLCPRSVVTAGSTRSKPVLWLAKLLQPFSTMAVSGSGEKALESPFSYAEMYGTEHPTHGLKASSTVSGKRKSKGTKTKKHTPTSSASLKQNSKKKKKQPTSRIASYHSSQVALVKNLSPSSSSTSTFSMPKVDHDSSCSAPVEKAKLKVRCLSPLSGTSNPTCSATDNGRVKTRFLLPTEPSTIETITATTTTMARKNNKDPNPTTSLLTFSKLSTSDFILTMNRKQEDFRGGNSQTYKGGVAYQRSSSSNRESINLPPHMRLPRQDFHSTGPNIMERIGRKKGLWPTDVEEIARGLGRCHYRNIIVMSGAGISTPSGIPDFRSPGTGLYDNLQQYKIPEPMSIFDITYFSQNPKPFFTLAKELFPGKYRPNTVHHFVKLLQEKKVLLRNYTQNIDGLERIAGIHPGKLVEAHGSFATASCIQCKTKQEITKVKASIFGGRTPRCKHKNCFGLVKPDIVFFGEDLPARFHSLQLHDFAKCDLLIVMGTSLEVEPFASLAALPRFNVPRLLLNRELVGPFKHQRKRSTDVAMTGDLVRSVQDLVKSAGWETDLERLVNPVSSVVSSGGAGAPQKSIDDDRLQVSLEAGCRISEVPTVTSFLTEKECSINTDTPLQPPSSQPSITSTNPQSTLTNHPSIIDHQSTPYPSSTTILLSANSTSTPVADLLSDLTLSDLKEKFAKEKAETAAGSITPTGGVVVVQSETTPTFQSTSIPESVGGAEQENTLRPPYPDEALDIISE